jgi:hypothetical protein
MSELRDYPVQLLRVGDRQFVDARLCRVASKHLEDFRQHWRSQLSQSSEADQSWEWEQKLRVYGSRLGAEAYAIECEGHTQGLMLIETLGHRSWFDPNRRIVYIHFLATAPWNRSSLQSPPLYRLVGSLLLDFARYRSQELKYGGLVGLHALPEAEAFYRRCNLSACGHDPEQDYLMYFEWYQRQTMTREVEGETIKWDSDESDTEA